MRANRYELMIGAGLIFFSVAMSALALEEREWKARKGPDRHEGIQMQLKGAQLELLSAAVLYKQEPRQDFADYRRYRLAEAETPVCILRDFPCIVRLKNGDLITVGKSTFKFIEGKA